MPHNRNLSTPSRTVLRGRCFCGILVAVLCFAWTSPTPAQSAATKDELNGSIRIIGTDTLKQLMGRWIATFSALHPAVPIELANRALTAAPGRVDGTADLAPLGREFTPTKLAVFHSSRTCDPTDIAVAGWAARSGAGWHLHAAASVYRSQAARQLE